MKLFSLTLLLDFLELPKQFFIIVIILLIFIRLNPFLPLLRLVIFDELFRIGVLWERVFLRLPLFV